MKLCTPVPEGQVNFVYAERHGKEKNMCILGIIHSKGNYQGNDYDNIKFLCFDDDVPKGLLAGQPVYTVKVKSDVVVDCFGKSIKSIDWEKVIGSEILPTYNRYGQPIAISISYADGSNISMETTNEGPVPTENPEDPPIDEVKKPKGK